MVRILAILLFISLASVGVPGVGIANAQTSSQQDCERITEAALPDLVSIFTRNDFSRLEPVLNTIQSTCGESEFTQRLRILRALMERQPSTDLISDYLTKNYPEALVRRWDYTVEERYAEIYQDNKEEFNFVPLRHPIDSLVKIKADALLNSPSFDLTAAEEEIALLLADHIDAFYDSYQEANPRPQSQTRTSTQTRIPQEGSIAQKNPKYRHGVSIYAGAELPLTGSDPVFKAAPTVGVFYSSPLSNPFLFEAGIKARFNTHNNYEVEYELYDQVEVVRSAASLSFGATLGYKVFDNDDWIIAPKAGLFWELATTGLSEVNEGYYDDGYDYYETEHVRYFFISTMRSSLALSAMRHLSGKTYIGLEAAYHYVPYNWDNSLLTQVQPNYGSLQLFFRF